MLNDLCSSSKLPKSSAARSKVQSALAQERIVRTGMGYRNRVGRLFCEAGAARLADVSVLIVELAVASFGDRFAIVGARACANFLCGGEEGCRAENLAPERRQNTHGGISPGSRTLAPPTLVR